MGLNVFIQGEDSRTVANVTPEGEIVTAVSPHPPMEAQKSRPFRQYFTVDGLATGSNDMGVNGSSTNVEFYIPASTTDDRYITTLSFIVGYGATGEPFEFADATALTNGVRIFYANNQGEIDIHDGIKSNQDLFRLGFQPVPTAWEVRGVNATNDYGYFVTFDLLRLMPPYGVKLDPSTKQRLSIVIRDNCTNADSFNCIAYGFDRFK